MEETKPVDWQSAGKQLQKEYPQLTAEDLRYEAGKEEEWLENIAKKVNKNKHDIRKWLSFMG